MNKTAGEVETDVYAIIYASALKTLITGTVYKEGVRPVNAKTEDAIVAFITGLDGQFQTGAVNVNIYVPDIDNGSNALVKNVTRCKTIEVAGKTLINSLKPTDYKFSLASTIQSFAVEGISQHFVNIKIKFELKTF